MKFREPASKKSGKKAGVKQMAMTSAAPKRIAATKKSAPSKKPPVKKTAAAVKKAVPAKKAPPSPKQAPKKAAAAVKKGASPVKAPQPAAKPVPPAGPRLATPIASEPQPQAKVAAPAPKPAMPPARPAASAQSEAERRKAVTRKFFARLRSLEAIIGADLRKRGSVVLMQAVDQWYSEAISATATDISITNAAKVVIAHL